MLLAAVRVARRIAGVLTSLFVPIALFIGIIGALEGRPVLSWYSSPLEPGPPDLIPMALCDTRFPTLYMGRKS